MSGGGGGGGEDSSAELLLPYKCTVCEYRARWPSEITQHMKNHSDEKPYKCPRCSYRSKWKWDVVKHLKRCGGGTVKDVIDTTKIRRQMHVNAILAGVPSLGASPPLAPSSRELSRGPPNVTVVPSREHRESSSGMDESAAEDTEEGSEHGSGAGFGVGVSGGGTALPQQQHFCPHCPFVASSSAELRRHHVRTHSEDKPYICKTCGYCSKWKCDLKKHLRTYDHQSAVPLTYGGHGRKPADWEEEKEGKEEEEASDEEAAAAEDVVLQGRQCHVSSRQHHRLDDHIMSVHNNNKQQPAAGKLKCKQCDFSADDLPAFLQHKISHQATPAMQQRKQLAEEEQGAPPTPQMKHRRKPLKHNITKTVHDDNDEEDAAAADEEGGGGGGEVTAAAAAAYPCEWCTFSASKSLELYHHVRAEHPEDMELDDYEMEPTQKNTGGGKENEISKSVIACEWCTWSTTDGEEMYKHMEAEHQSDKEGGDSTTEIKIYRGESRKVAKRRLKQCHKCAYVTDNISTLQRHMSKHGKKAKYSCSYCDYSVEREHIIEYHMSLVHKDDYSANHNAHVLRTLEAEEEDDYEDGEEDEAYFGQEDNSMDSEQADMIAGDELDDVESSANPRRGYTVLQIHRGKRTKYACQTCPYRTENLTNMSNHARQHGANKKYTCEFCDYSLDQRRHVAKHMKTQHGHDTGTAHEDSDAANGLDGGDAADREDDNDNDEELTDVSENEWEIAEVDGSSSVVDADEAAEDSPTKRRRLHRISTSSAQSSILQYTCKTCGFNTRNKALVAKHNHKEGSEVCEGKPLDEDKEPKVDINRNTTEVTVQ